MRRFQNATMEYNASKNDLVIRDVKTNGIFFFIWQILSIYFLKICDIIRVYLRVREVFKLW